jgi:hypothetical protein
MKKERNNNRDGKVVKENKKKEQ